MDFAGRSLKAQMKQANKAMARYVVMLGEDEVNDSCVILKDMITSDQEKIAIQEVVNKLYAEVKD
jgi:histidyl-tRNA synthetase